MPGPHAGAEVLKTIAVMPQNAMTSSADPLEQDFTPDRNDPALFPSPLPLSGLLGLPPNFDAHPPEDSHGRQKVPFCAPRTERVRIVMA
jgi:hypothetical protein